MKKYVILALVTGLAGSAYFAADYYVKSQVDAAVASWFEGLRAQGYAQASYGDISINILTRSATVRDLVISRATGPGDVTAPKRATSAPRVADGDGDGGALELTIETLSLSGVQTLDDGTYTLTSLAMSKGRLATINLDVSFEAAKATDISVVPTRARIPDNATLSPEVTRLIRTLFQFSAASLEVTSLLQSVSLEAASPFSLYWENIAFEGITKGDIEAGHFRALRVAAGSHPQPSASALSRTTVLAPPDQDRLLLWIQEADFSQFSLLRAVDTLLRQVPSLDAQSARTWADVLGKLELQAIAVNLSYLAPKREEIADVFLRTKTASICPCRFRPQLDNASKSELHRLLSSPAKDVTPVGQAILRLITANLAVDAVDIAELELQGPGQENLPFGIITYLVPEHSIDALSLSGYQAHHVQTLTLSGVTVLGSGGSMLTIAGIDISSIDLFASDAGQSRDPINRGELPAGSVAEQVFNVLLGVHTGGLQINEVSLTTQNIQPLRIGSVDFRADGYTHLFPDAASVDVRGIVISTELVADPGLRQTIRDLGYETLEASVRGAYAWQDQQSVMQIRDAQLHIKDAGEIVIDADLHGVLPHLFDPRHLQETVLSRASLGDLRIHFANDTLVERIFDWVTLTTKLPYQSQLVLLEDKVRVVTDRFENADFQNAAVEAARAFVATPKSLTLNARPPKPVPLLQLVLSYHMLPKHLPDLLNVTISANELP